MGTNLCTIGVQIGCNRGCKTRRNAGFRMKGRGFESLVGALYAHARHSFFTLSKRRRLPALIVDQGRLLTGALYAHVSRPLDRSAFSLSRCPKSGTVAVPIRQVGRPPEEETGAKASGARKAGENRRERMPAARPSS